MGLLLKKNYILRYCGWLSLLNCIGALTLSLLPKLPPRILEAWFVLWSFFVLRLLCISVNLPYIHAWNTVVMSGLVLLVASWNCEISCKNRYARFFTCSPPEPLPHLPNVVILTLFYRYYFARFLSELVQRVSFPYSRGRSTCYSDRLHVFSVTIPRCYKDVYVNSFFPSTGRLWKYLPEKCFLLNYDLNSFMSRINRHFLTVGSL